MFASFEDLSQCKRFRLQMSPRAAFFTFKTSGVGPGMHLKSILSSPFFKFV